MWMNGPSSVGGPSGQQLERSMARAQVRAQRAAQRPSAGQVTWRWMTGAPLDGAPRTDAGWFRPGVEDLTPPAKRAHRWDYWPRWKRAGWRGGTSTTFPAAGTGFLLDPATTLAVLTVAFVCGAGIGAWRIRRAARIWRVQREIARPLALTLSRVTGDHPGRIMAEMKLPPDYQSDQNTRIVVPLPDDHRPFHVSEVGKIVSERLGGEWTGKKSEKAPYTITYMHKPAPPTRVDFEEVRELIEREGSQSKILMGIGTNGDPVWIDFDGDIAHMAMSIGTGGGKTTFVQLLLAQLAYHGVCDFEIVDVKMDGYKNEIDSLPGMKIHQYLQDQWDALEFAYQEMERRYHLRNEDKSQVFPRKFIVLEEQNVFAKRTKAAWRKIKTQDDPPQAPVWDAVAELLFMGRAVNMNVLGIYQRLTADAAGGTEMRDQYGLKALSRFSHQAWDSLVGTRPRGVSSPVVGRWITVMGSLQRSVQVPYGTASELSEWVRTRPGSYTATDVSFDLPQSTSPEGVEASPYEVKRPLREAGEGEAAQPAPRALESAEGRLSADEALGLAGDEAEPVARYTLKEAEKAGVLPVPYERAKKHRQNDEKFPSGVKDGRSRKFTEEEIKEYYKKRY